jgi:hypothetical protein
MIVNQKEVLVNHCTNCHNEIPNIPDGEDIKKVINYYTCVKCMKVIYGEGDFKNGD